MTRARNQVERGYHCFASERNRLGSRRGFAVLSVIAREVQRRDGACALPLDALAALAGVSRTTVQNLLRQARHLGLLEVKERRRRGLPSLTNVLRVISPEWIAWLKLSGEGGGFRNLSATNNKFIQERKNGFNPVDQKGAQRETVENPKGPCRPLAQRVTFY